MSNIAPQQTHDMVQKFFDGDVNGSIQMQLKAVDLIESLFCEVNPIPVKKAMNLLGMEAGPMRRPLTEMEPENAKRLADSLKNFGLL